MKKLVWLLGLFLLLSLACQVLVPARQAIPGVPGTSESVIKSLTATAMIVSATSTRVPIPEAITCTDAACLNTCLQRIEKVMPHTYYEAPVGTDANPETLMNLVYYDVKDGQLGEPQFLHIPDSFQVYQQDTAAQQTLWDYASHVMTPDVTKWISRFGTFLFTGDSAIVMPSDPDRLDRSHWTLKVDLEYAQDSTNLTRVLVHEAGHLIFENTEQAPASDYVYGWAQNPAICKQFLSPLGCSKPDSYINQFYQIFWKDFYEEWETQVDRPTVSSTEERWRLVEAFYQKHREQFLGPYQASNIEEDMAESFARFVVDPRPAGDSAMEQKILFFYEYPELVALKQQMIQEICSYTGE